MYRLTKEEYVKRQRNQITSTYKKQTTSRKESTLKEIMENVDKKILEQIPGIKQKVLRKSQVYNQKKRQCILCLNEKYKIACYKGDNLLNKRTEILGTCRHRDKYKLKNCDSKD